MRNPNGYGCIKKLSGQRRRPFAFVVSKNGKQRIVEYFTNQADAQIFQADYNKAHLHHVLPGHQVTLAELYHRWLPAHIADADPSDSALASYILKHGRVLRYCYLPIATNLYAPKAVSLVENPIRAHRKSLLSEPSFGNQAA